MRIRKEPNSRELVISLAEVLVTLSLEQDAVNYLLNYLSLHSEDSEVQKICINCQQRLLVKQKREL